MDPEARFGPLYCYQPDLCEKAMPLKPLDRQHFYLDDTLIDLVWIAHQVKKQTNAANYHEMNRSLNWLNKLAHRLLSGNTSDDDERLACKRLEALGVSWYLE